MFGAPLKEHDLRYDHLAEWLEIMTRPWTEDEEFDFDGEFFKIIKGASRPKPFQRPHPPIMNAGSFGRGRDFALQVADMCFVQISSDEARLDLVKQEHRGLLRRAVKAIADVRFRLLHVL